MGGHGRAVIVDAITKGAVQHLQLAEHPVLLEATAQLNTDLRMGDEGFTTYANPSTATSANSSLGRRALVVPRQRRRRRQRNEQSNAKRRLGLAGRFLHRADCRLRDAAASGVFAAPTGCTDPTTPRNSESRFSGKFISCQMPAR